MTETLTPQREIEAPREVTEADVLERAAYLLEEFGWCQDHLAEDDYGPFVFDMARDLTRLGRANAFCVNGALARARLDLGGEGEERVLLRASLGMNEYDERTSVWNDAPGRTKTEVIQALRAAASSARTKEEA